MATSKKIKVCGITLEADLFQLKAVGAHWAGLIFAPDSPRFVAGKLDPVRVKTFKELPKVGVFVNALEQDILDAIDTYGLNMVQLHGQETPAFCESVRRHVKVIKAFRVRDTDSLSAMTAAYVDHCHYFLFDAYGKLPGGNGILFNWEVLNTYDHRLPFLLSGGIGPDSIQAIKALRHPKLFGIDVNSRFEESPGVKNMSSLKSFIWDLSFS